MKKTAAVMDREIMKIEASLSRLKAAKEKEMAKSNEVKYDVKKDKRMKKDLKKDVKKSSKKSAAKVVKRGPGRPRKVK